VRRTLGRLLTALVVLIGLAKLIFDVDLDALLLAVADAILGVPGRVSLAGRTLILIALAASAIGAVVGISAGYRRSAEGWRWASHLAMTVCVAMVLATGLMEYALLTRDFSVAYVAQVGSRSVPDYIAFVSLWSSLEGSILLWGFALGVLTGAFAWLGRGKNPDHNPYALGVLLAVNVFFHFLVASIANPFAPVSPVPLDGPGPNPLLQNHALMVVHPPTLYIGFVGMAVPFAMAAAALMAGRVNTSWISQLRRWMLIPWSFLSLGIMLGGWWSYEVLGWGGYWAWDPVENASFMPWLTATAFLHSAMVMERRGVFKAWTLSLAMASFLLTLLGTFMTRSGVFNSVHSFTQSSIGPVFLVFLGACLVFTVVLLAARMDLLAAAANDSALARARAAVLLAAKLESLAADDRLALERGVVHADGAEAALGPLVARLGSDLPGLRPAVAALAAEQKRARVEGRFEPVSKPGAFLLNNLLFAAFTFTVLLGTVFPLLNEALAGERISVGQPYFNKMTIPICIGLLFLMGVGPALPWGRPTPEQLKRQFVIPAVASLAVVAACAAAGLTAPWALATFGMGAFATVVTVREFTTPAAQRAARLGESFPAALFQVINRGRRRAAGHLVHMGVVVMAVGIAVSSTWRHEANVNLKVGGSEQVGAYTLTLVDTAEVREPHRKVTVASYTVTRDGKHVADLAPSINHYTDMGMNPIPTPDVWTGPLEDFYLSVIRVDPASRSAAVTVVIEPLVSWVWIGGIVIFFGGLLSIIPWGHRRRAARERRLDRLREFG